MNPQKWLLIIASLAIVGINPILAQESAPGDCFDSKDNDGDGFVDCFDPDCIGVAECDSIFYFGTDSAICQYIPSPDSFGAQTDWITDTSKAVSPWSSPVVADIDLDGIPEVIAQGVGQNPPLPQPTVFRVFNGATGAWEQDLDITLAATDVVPRAHASTVAIANLDGDAFGEIVVVTNGGRVIVFEHDGSLKWNTAANQIGYGITNFVPVPAVADFDQNCVPEIYAGNHIFNSSTGALIAEGGSGSSMGRPGTEGYALSIAADIAPPGACTHCDGLELVCGNTVYWVDISGGTMGVLAEITTADYNDGFSGVADYDMDGDLDVVVSAPLNLTTKMGKVYVWDGASNNSIIAEDSLKGNGVPGFGGTASVGPATVADFDNDGLPEIGLAGDDLYIVYDDHTSVAGGNFGVLWQVTSIDQSAVTGSSVFDFNGDNAYEVIYRDSAALRVYDGATGTVLQQLTCASGTVIEHPIVVDVDGEEQTEIVCSCDFRTVPAVAAVDARAQKGRIHAFRSQNVPWIPSRKIWNQHSYFNVNIYDDMTVPGDQQAHQHWPRLNNFLTQSTFLDETGGATYPAPDAIMTRMEADLSDIGDATDSPDSICVDLYITNSSSNLLLERDIPVSIYLENPWDTLFTATLLDQVVTPVKLDSADTIAVKGCYLCPDDVSGSAYTIFAVVNDDGANGTTPYDSLPNIWVGECDYTNNTQFLAFDACVLPIDDLELTGVLSNGDAILGWTSYNEVNMDRFELYRMLEGEGGFERVATKFAKGDPGQSTHYPYKDITIPTGPDRMYYKVKGYDKTGKFMESNVVELSRAESITNGLVNIYPNPAKDHFTVEYFAESSNEVSLEILNGIGQQVMNIPALPSGTTDNYQEEIYLPDLKGGIYFVKMVYDGKSDIRKLQIY